MGFTDTLNTIQSGMQSMTLVFSAALFADATPFTDSIGTTYGKPLAAGGANLDVINIDATLSEVHTAEVELTQHPVETGADITDHARQKPREIRIDGFVTNTPFDSDVVGPATMALALLARGANTLGIQTDLNPLTGGSAIIRDAFDKFQLLYQYAAPCQIFTPYRQYQNMVMVSFQSNREQKNGDALRFTATFREVNFVSSQMVNVQTQPIAQGALDMGTQSPTPGSGKLVSSTKTQLEQWYGTQFNKVGLVLPPRQ